MEDDEHDSGKPSFLSREWLKLADGIARHSHGLASVADVPPEHRDHVLDRVGEVMEARGVVAPKDWRATLSAQCGWSKA